VRLAVEQLNTCHTQPDVERVLQELPVGMEALYDRMAESIVERSPADRDFASLILQFATCALRVLTTVELSRALDKDDILDIQRTIFDLGGGFVVVDNSGNISMVHQTAREYLLHGTGDRPFHVDRAAANKQLLLSCMSSLTATGLRGQLGRHQMPEFLDYAAGGWSSHLIAAPIDCRETADAVRKFLTGPWVLTWIHVLAQTQRLGILVRASKHLARYADGRREYSTTQPASHHHQHISEVELLECWAVDFAKLAGKFGRNLGRNPQSIYKIIPPFCPHNSAIYQQFGKAEARTLSVTGFSTDNWDDSLGRISFGFSTYASFIQVAGAYIFVLVSSGVVFVYSSSTLDQHAHSPIKQGERLYRMQPNSKGTVLVTYGYRNTKVWDVATGTCTLAVENVEKGLRPLVMLLNGNLLLVGTDDKRIRSLSLDQSPPTWGVVAELDEPELEGHYINAANHMAFGHDGSLVTVAYRGHPLSAWETDGPSHIGHLWMKYADYRGEVLEVIWHPHEPQVFGLYTTGQIFQWLPYENEVEEKPVGANRLTMSRDGNLLATGDVRGTVKVFTTSTLSLIYHVASQDLVLGLAFSPDLRRLYDIRGFYGNVWGPSALLKYAEAAGRRGDAESDLESISQSSAASENKVRWTDPVTVLAASPIGRWYCFGTEKGTVTLSAASRGKITDIKSSRNSFSIDHIAWSPDGRLVCFSDPSKKVSIASIEAGAADSDPTVGAPVVVPMPNTTKGTILQMVFSPDSSSILVHTESEVHKISIATSSVAKSAKLATPKCRWIIHPQDSSLVIGLAPNSAHILDWELDERQTYNLDYPISKSEKSTSTPLSPSSAPVTTVDRVLVAQNKTHVLAQISTSAQTSGDKTFLYISASSLAAVASKITSRPPDESQDEAPELPTIRPTVLPSNVSSQIALALAFLPNNRLVVLTKAFQVCVWSISTGGPAGPSPTRGVGSVPRPLAKPFGPAPGAQSGRIPTATALASRNAGNRSAGNDGVLGTELFALPGDWISRECLQLCTVWTKERSLLCPRNGEVGVVRSAALA